MITQAKSIVRNYLFKFQIYYEYLKRLVSRYILGRSNEGVQLVVCGYPRSGTSMFYNMLSSTLEGFSFTEGEESTLKTIWKYGNYATKCPHDAIKLSNRKIQELNLQNKKLCVLVVIRDIRDIVTSKHQWAPDDYMIGYRDNTLTINGVYPNYIKRFNGPGIGKYFDAIKNVSESNELNTVVVRYEDLVSKPDELQDEIGKKFGFRFNSKFSEYHHRNEMHKLRYEGKKAPIDEKLRKSSSKVTGEYVNRWRLPEHRERLTEQFTNNPELLDILVDYSYESSKNWYADYVKEV